MKAEENDHPFWKKKWKMIRKNPLSLILFLILFIVLMWFLISSKTKDKQHLNELNVLKSKYESQLDSIKIQHIQFCSEVFSWSVRSELLRENLENLKQLFHVFVRRSQADLVQLVNVNEQKIWISTDKKFEGNSFTVPEGILLKQTSVITNDSQSTIYTPIMGYNSVLAILIVELHK
jgi:Ca2+/Na+ antiporter